MRIEAVCVCKGFGDILGHAMIHSQTVFDDFKVVTSKDDDVTHRVCKKHGWDYIDTDAFTRKGYPFDKGRAINVGLAHLTCKDWILHIDADIILPPHTRRFLDNAELNTQNIYGIDRFDIVGWDNYQKWLHTIDPQYSWQCLINPPVGCQFGSRIVHYDYGGWMPIGFFQLWHGDSRITRYPVKIDSNAEHVDVLHSMKWPRPNRVLIPEIYGYHIKSEKLGARGDWDGRKSKKFECPKPYLP